MTSLTKSALLSICVCVACVWTAEATPERPRQPVPPGINGLFEGNPVLDELGMAFAVTNHGSGIIELDLVKGNLRVRGELAEGTLTARDLNVDFMAALEEEVEYERLRYVLREVVSTVSRETGVRQVLLTGSVDTAADRRAEAEFRAGLRRYEAGEFGLSVPYFERAAAMGFPRAQRTLGFIYENGQGVRQDRAMGREYYKKAAEQGEAEAFYNLGRMTSAEGNFDGALAYYQKAIQLNPELAMAYNNVGYLLNELRYYEKAIPFLKRAIELNPGYAGSYSNLGIALDNLGKHDEATTIYDEALTLNPEAADVRVNLGVTLMHQSRYEEAIDEFRKAIHLKPDWHQPYNGLGSIYTKRNELGLAVTAYRKLVKNRPHHPWGYKMLAETYAKIGEYGKASEAALSALEAAKGIPEYDVEMTKQIEQAYEEYQAAYGKNARAGS